MHTSLWSDGRRLATSAFLFPQAQVTEERAQVWRQVCTVQFHCNTAEALHRCKLALQVRHDSQSPALSLLVICFRTLTLDESVLQPADETREQGDCLASDIFSCIRFCQPEVAGSSLRRPAQPHVHTLGTLSSDERHGSMVKSVCKDGAVPVTIVRVEGIFKKENKELNYLVFPTS